jgi:hypothetical protein
MTNRYYSPSTGRFITRDPIGYEGGVNVYAYTRNNPVMKADPSGLDGDEMSDYFITHNGVEQPLRHGINAIGRTGTAILNVAASFNPFCNIMTTVTGVNVITNKRVTVGEQVFAGVSVVCAPAGMMHKFAEGGEVIKSVAALRVAENYTAGKDFETLVFGILGKSPWKTAVESATDSGRTLTVIPDDIDVAHKIVTEVKNCKYMYYSSQIQGQMNFANKYGYTFRLAYPEGMIMSPRLKRELKLAGAILLEVGQK